MPIIRNPFRRQDENARPATATSALNGVEALPKGAGTPTAKAKAVEIKEQEKQPAEYQLSEINDSGVYLPPSPPARRSFWSTTATNTNTASSRSTTSSHHRSLLATDAHANEQFGISRESFDSYRRSFDISARSPVTGAGPTRASLDTRGSLDARAWPSFQPLVPPPPPTTRSSSSFTRGSQVPAQTAETAEEENAPDATAAAAAAADANAFEDVDIADKPAVAQQPKKRGLFSRITDSGDHHGERPGSADGGRSSWHHLGRKRGQSGSGAELGSMAPKREGTPKAESALRKEGRVGKSEVAGTKGVGEDAGDGVVASEAPAQAGAEVAREAAQDRTETPELGLEGAKAAAAPTATPVQVPTSTAQTTTEEVAKPSTPQTAQAPE
ncbi:hypothetical protein LTR08_008984 [Meristemomyces frigidus]|nr:hypothetical protein LTR08_008984 [Meristemomyces frigidus]